MNKKIKQRTNTPGKHIRGHSTVSNIPTEAKKPIFSFQYLDTNYCISCCTKDEKAALADQLRILSTLSWAEIRNGAKHATGSEKIERNSITRPIPQHVKEDITFIALRFSGKKPMVGYRDGEVFHVLWLDRSFTLYNHG